MQYHAEGPHQNWGETSSRFRFLDATASRLQERKHGVVLTLLQAGVDMNAVTSDGLTALHIAAKYSHAGVMSLLLENGADNRALGPMGWTSLHYACYGGGLDAVLLLLGRDKVDIEAIGLDSWTPLYASAASGHVSIVELLLDREADYAYAARDEQEPTTALHLAATNGHVRVVQAVLDRIETCPNFRDHRGKTALDLAIESGSAACAELLIQRGVDITIADSKGGTLLHLAARTGTSHLAAVLFQMTTDINAVDDEDCTALLVAAKRGEVDIINLLHLNGANLNLTAPLKVNALHMAAVNRHVNAVEALLDIYYNIDAQTTNGYTALSMAAEGGSTEITRMLLKKRANVSIKDTRGRTALHWAAESGHTVIISLLLRYSCQLGEKTTDGRTALDLAFANNRETAVQLLLKEAPHSLTTVNGNGPLHLAAERGIASVISLVPIRGYHIDRPNDEGYTALHLACKAGHKEFVAGLLRKRASTKTNRCDVHTPFFMACQKGRVAIMQLLLKAQPLMLHHLTGRENMNYQTRFILLPLLQGRPVNVNDSSREETVLACAVRAGHTEVVRFLIKHGANTNPRACDHRKHPLQIALRRGNCEIVSALVGNDWQDTNTLQEALYQAAARCKIAFIRAIIEHSYKRSESEMRSMALAEAAHAKQAAMVKYVLSLGADVNGPGPNGWPPLYVSAMRGNTEAARIILEHGGDPSLRISTGMTPFLKAAEVGGAEMLGMMLEKGAAISEVNNWEETALHLAALRGRHDALQFLLEKGADVHARDCDGRTALDLASLNEKLTAVKFLSDFMY